MTAGAGVEVRGTAGDAVAVTVNGAACRAAPGRGGSRRYTQTAALPVPPVKRPPPDANRVRVAPQRLGQVQLPPL